MVTKTALISLDFADVKSVLAIAGAALVAIGEAYAVDRAVKAARAAITSPLLDVSIEGARGLLINVIGGSDLTLQEVTEAVNAVAEAVDPSANIIFGAVLHPRPQREVRITLIATGLRGAGEVARPPRRGERPLRGSSADLDPPPASDERGLSRRRPLGPPDADDDMDLPAFLRRRR